MSQSAHKPEPDLSQLASQSVESHSDLYREIFAHSKEAIAIINPDGSYLEQNGAHYTLLGYSDQELEGKTPAIHLGQETFLEIARQLAETGEYSGEVISRTKSGVERNIELIAEYTDNEKTVYYFIMEFISGDITKHDTEMEAVEWLQVTEVEDRLTYKADKKVWREALKNLKF